MSSLDSLFVELREELDRLPSEHGGAAFDRVLDTIAKSEDPQIIGRLCGFFVDDQPGDEVLWSVLHVIEHFDGPVYIKELLRASPSLAERSHEWATRLFIRVLNSEPRRDELAEQVRSSSEAVRAAVLTIMHRIDQDAPSEFDAKMAPVLARLA
ncbi:MAG: Imm30 family immunity protein [Planctomycetota bacterium]